MQTIIQSIKVQAEKAFSAFPALGYADIVDILIVAFAIYYAVKFIRKTGSFRVAVGIVLLLLGLGLSSLLNLNVVNYLLRQAVAMGAIAIVILFQPEIRRVLERVGSGKFGFLFGNEMQSQSMDAAITQVVLACNDMAKNKIGALILFERDNRLDDQIGTGTIIGAETTAELIKNIFYPNAPLHDGAVVIRDGLVTAAGCILPLSHNSNLSRDLGMRHRAGIGMSERSDAVIVIVSEQTGSVSVAVDGMLKRHLHPDTFEKLLRNELINDDNTNTNWIVNLFRGKKNGNKKDI